MVSSSVAGVKGISRITACRNDCQPTTGRCSITGHMLLCLPLDCMTYKEIYETPAFDPKVQRATHSTEDAGRGGNKAPAPTVSRVWHTLPHSSCSTEQKAYKGCHAPLGHMPCNTTMLAALAVAPCSTKDHTQITPKPTATLHKCACVPPPDNTTPLLPANFYMGYICLSLGY